MPEPVDSIQFQLNLLGSSNLAKFRAYVLAFIQKKYLNIIITKNKKVLLLRYFLYFDDILYEDSEGRLLL